MTSLTTNYYKLIGPKQLIMEEVAIELLSSDEYLVQTLYSAISPGTETAAYAGLDSLRPGSIYPRVVGYCNIGKVIQVGVEVHSVKRNDLILTFQSHRTAFKQKDCDFSMVMPEGVIPEKTVTAYLFHLGLHAMQTADVRAGHHVGIIGLGTLGLTTALMTNLANAQVFVFSNQQKPGSLNKKGIHFFSKSITHDTEVLQLTQNTGLDIIINTSNTWSDWKLGLQLLRKGGVIVNLGFPGRGEPLPDFNPLDPQYLYFKNIRIKPLDYIDETNAAPEVFRFNMKRNLEYIVQNLTEGNLTTDTLISEHIPYTHLQEQYEKYLKRNVQLYTSVLDWTHA